MNQGYRFNIIYEKTRGALGPQKEKKNATNKITLEFTSREGRPGSQTTAGLPAAVVKIEKKRLGR